MTGGATPDFTLRAGERMGLVAVLGRDGVRAVDAVLAKLRAGEKPTKAEVVALARTLHENGVVDFSDWPAIQKRRACHAGHPASRPKSTLKR